MEALILVESDASSKTVAKMAPLFCRWTPNLDLQFMRINVILYYENIIDTLRYTVAISCLSASAHVQLGRGEL